MNKDNLISHGALDCFVPKEYRFYKDSKEEKRAGGDDRNIELPSIYFDEDCNMFVLQFLSADIGGYDVARFKYYFWDIETLLTILKRKGG